MREIERFQRLPRRGGSGSPVLGVEKAFARFDRMERERRALRCLIERTKACAMVERWRSTASGLGGGKVADFHSDEHAEAGEVLLEVSK